MRTFRERILELVKDKKSILCVGIDPVPPHIRNKHIIPDRYLQDVANVEDAILSFMLDIVDAVQERVICIKVNMLFLLAYNFVKIVRSLTSYCHKRDIPVVLDYKLNDIDDSVQIGLTHMYTLDVDAVTVNPLPGNVGHIVKTSSELAFRLGKSTRLGILVLTFMSNVDAVKYFRGAHVNNLPLYLHIANEVRESDADGCIVGATYTQPEEMKRIREVIGPERIIFIPGVGAQGGSIELVRYALPGIVLVNVGRSVVYAPNVREAVTLYYNLTRSIADEVVRSCM